MNFRLATMDDLPQLKVVYGEIIKNMKDNNIEIWDDIYPCEFFFFFFESRCLYILEENKDIVAAFALYSSNGGADYVEWENKNEAAIYIDRLGVNVNYSRKGIGSIMLNKAIELTKEKGIKYLRLFVVDINKPAINLYVKNGFNKAEGIYDEVIDEELTLHQYGYEINTFAALLQ